MVINQLFCVGGGHIGSDSLLRMVQVFSLSTALLQYTMRKLVLEIGIGKKKDIYDE